MSSKNTAILFPGQGSLTPDAAEHARVARGPSSSIAPRSSSAKIRSNAPSASTRFAQPAIFVASMAAWRERDDDLRDVCAMAGHSLGELSALAAAGALTVDDALALVVAARPADGRRRGRAPDGGMVALLGGDAGPGARAG